MKKIITILLPFLLVSCANISREDLTASKHVKIVDTSFLNSGKQCRKLGKVAGNSAGDLRGESAAISHMKSRAHKRGGNIVVSSLRFKKTMGVLAPADIVNGIVYKCSKKIFAKLQSIEELAYY